MRCAQWQLRRNSPSKINWTYCPFSTYIVVGFFPHKLRKGCKYTGDLWVMELLKRTKYIYTQTNSYSSARRRPPFHTPPRDRGTRPAASDFMYRPPPGGRYCHTKAVGVCRQSPMEHMERKREKPRNVWSPRENY